MSEIMADIGEKRFLKNILPRLFIDPSFLNGFGHDTSLIDLGFEDQLLVMNIDRAPLPIITRRGWDNYRLWGRLTVTTNCSDILASGGIPKAVMLCICVPGTWSIEDVADIILGCEEECRLRKVAFVGGDTNESSRPEVVGSAIGLVNRKDYLPRDGAEAGQLVVLAGSIGGFIGSYLQLAYRDLNTISQKQREEWVQTASHPTAKWVEAEIVRCCGGASAGMDTSDGLYDVLVSMIGDRIGVEIDLEALPYHPTMIECSHALGVPIFNTSLGVGDWNIVYAVSEDRFEQMKDKARANNASLTVIGRFAETLGITARDSQGRRFRISGSRNEHFKGRIEHQDDFIGQLRSHVSLIPL